MLLELKDISLTLSDYSVVALLQWLLQSVCREMSCEFQIIFQEIMTAIMIVTSSLVFCWKDFCDLCMSRVC